MLYKTAAEIYDEEVAVKRLMIPVAALSTKEKLYFDMIANRLSLLSEDLNATPDFWQFFMFGTRKEYKKLSKEFREFLEFWAFDIETIKSGKFCRIDGES